MKRNYRTRSLNGFATLNEKCDLIVELLEQLLSNPDFMITCLRRSAARQHEQTRKRAWEARRHDSE